MTYCCRNCFVILLYSETMDRQLGKLKLALPNSS